MSKTKKNMAIVSIILSSLTLILVVVILLGYGANENVNDYTAEKNMAGELGDYNLYQASVEEYKKILLDNSLETATRANINYLIAKIYFNDIFDYENAAAYYLRARSLNPDGSFYDEAGKNLIACFEKMGRIVDAKRELDKTVNLDSIQAAHDGEKTIAKIGDRPIFQSEIESAIQQLPPDVQKQFLDKKGKAAFLSNYIATELMHQAAIREGFDSDREVLEKKAIIEKQILVEKYMTDKVMPEVNIDTVDMRNYYLANKSGRYENKNFDDIRSQVFMDYQNEKAQQAFSEYIAKLSAVSKVEIFEENIE